MFVFSNPVYFDDLFRIQRFDEVKLFYFLLGWKIKKGWVKSFLKIILFRFDGELLRQLQAAADRHLLEKGTAGSTVLYHVPPIAEVLGKLK